MKEKPEYGPWQNSPFWCWFFLGTRRRQCWPSRDGMAFYRWHWEYGQ